MSGETKVGSATWAVRVVVLNEVIVIIIVVTWLEGKDEGVCVDRAKDSGERSIGDVPAQTHSPNPYSLQNPPFPIPEPSMRQRALNDQDRVGPGHSQLVVQQ